MVKRLLDNEVTRVKNKFAMLGDNIVFSLSPVYNNTLFAALAKQDTDTLKDSFDKSSNYVVKLEVLEKFTIALGRTNNNSMYDAWDELERNEPHTHIAEGWEYDLKRPNDGGYALFAILENAYIYFSGKDVEYND